MLASTDGGNYGIAWILLACGNIHLSRRQLLAAYARAVAKSAGAAIEF